MILIVPSRVPLNMSDPRYVHTFCININYVNLAITGKLPLSQIHPISIPWALRYIWEMGEHGANACIWNAHSASLLLIIPPVKKQEGKRIADI